MTTTPVAYRRIQRHLVPPDRQISVSLPADATAEGVRRLRWLALVYASGNRTGFFARLVLAAVRGQGRFGRWDQAESIAEAASTALHRTATKCTMTTKTKTQVSKRQFISALATIPSTIGMCHLAVYLKLGTPAEGWASLTGFFVALPGWMALARRYRRR
jgi:hypothetical protein